jgi:serine/threonine-protein kinase
MAQRDAWIGRALGERYRIDARLGEGGMAVVYRAVDLRTGVPVAIKLLHGHLAGDAQIVERFRREALAASAIGHPGIVEVIELGALPDGTRFLVMELLEGRDLGQLLRAEGPLSVRRATRIARAVAEALAAAHAKGIVHRDLKPENVFVIEDATGDRVKLLDFGISKLLGAIQGLDAPSATRTGTTLGTPHYMAPEQAQAQKDVDHRVDVYALGVILYRALTGQHPFDDASLPVLIVKICVDPPPPLRRYRGDVPEELVQVIERMLAKDRNERFASMDDVRAALAPFEDVAVEPWVLEAPPTVAEKASALSDRTQPDPHASTHAAHDDDDPPGPPPGARAPIPAWLGIVAVLFVLLGIGALAWQAWGGDPPVEPEPAMAPLPTPRPPRAQPMVAMGGGGEGWGWVNPRPRAMPTWYAIDVASGGDPVVVVGRRGTAVRYEGGDLFAWRTGTDRELRGVAWTGAREALAVGEEGTLVRLTPDGPRVLDTGLGVTLRDVVAVSPTEAVVVGDGGAVLRVRGERVSRADVGVEQDLLSAFARGEQVFVVGAGGTVLRLEGTTVARERSGVSASLRAVGGCPSGGVYAAGDEGVLLRRLRDGGWQRLRTPDHEAFTALSCDHGRVAAVRRDGRVILVSGEATAELPSGFESPWYAVAGGATGSSWLAGAGGRLATIEEDHVRTRSAGPTVPIRALGSMGGALVAVGEWGRILRERERGLEQVESPTDAGLAGLVQLGEGQLLAVGDYGALVDVRFDRAVLVPSPTQVSLRAGVADGGRLLLVGAQGHLLRGTLEALRPSVVAGAGDLWSVAGTPNDAIAVGEGGMVLQVSETGTTRIACDGAQTLRAVVRTPEGVWAVGDEGRIVRIERSGCVEERRGGPTLHAIGVGPLGRLLAGGDEGTVLVRRADGTWADEPVDVSGASVRVIWRSDRDVYLAGTDGVLVRHVRLE